MFDVEAGKHLQRLFGLDHSIHTHNMATLKPVTRGLLRVDNQRQKAAVKREHVHPKRKRREVFFTRVTNLAKCQFRQRVIME